MAFSLSENNQSQIRIPIFHYGEMQSSGEKFNLIKDKIVTTPIPVTAKGVLYRSLYGNFPALLLSSYDGTEDICGEIIIFEHSYITLSDIGVEKILPGMTLRWIYINHKNYQGKAITVIWEWEKDYKNPIEHGDWLRYKR